MPKAKITTETVSLRLDSAIRDYEEKRDVSAEDRQVINDELHNAVIEALIVLGEDPDDRSTLRSRGLRGGDWSIIAKAIVTELRGQDVVVSK